MKKAFVIIILLFWFSSGHSQSPAPYTGLFTGLSLPVGRFASCDLEGGSFALPGWKSGAEGAWFSRIGLGAGLQAGFQAYPLDVSSLAREKMQANAFIDSLSVRSDPFSFFTVAGVAMYSFDAGKGLSVVARAGGGIIYGWSPYQLYKPSYYLLGPVWYEITSDYDMGPYATAGASLRYRFCDCLEAQAQLSFSYGFLQYQFLTGTGDVRTEDHQVLTLDATVGVAYTF